MPRKKSDQVAEVVAKALDRNEKHPKTTGATSGRRFTPASYRSRRKRRGAEKYVARTKVANVFVLFGRSLKILRDHWEVFGGIVLIYIILNVVLVGGAIGGSELQSQKESLADYFTGEFSKLGTGLTLFSFLLTSSVTISNSPAGAFQTFLFIFVSLAIVWALRQFYAGNQVRIRDTFYNSTYPFVQLLAVLGVVIVQIAPAGIGAFLFRALVLQGILIGSWQQAIATLICLFLVVWTIYMLCASLFAAYIVTLPDMTPLKALRAAKDIVQYRRAMVMRKILFLPLAMVVISGLIIIPLTITLAPVATVVFFVLGALSLPLTHSYMYVLYRDLIQQ